MSSQKNSDTLLFLPSLLFASAFSLMMLLAACTPEYTRKQSEDFAGQARLLDSIDIEHQNERLLSRQAQVCLVSADGGEEGADLLRTMQSGFIGYFRSVSVVGESIDYLRAISTAPCPGASYLFYVQPVTSLSCERDQSCKGATAQFIITVIHAEDHQLLDRVKLSIHNSFLPTETSEFERRKKAFEKLAIALTGAT